jgi:hypothetical protein
VSAERLAFLIALAALAVWAAAPITPVTVDARTSAAREDAPHPLTVASLDLEAFRTPLWVAPPATAVAPPPPPALPPIRLQLVAVVFEDGVYGAMLYDPDADKVLLVHAGDSVGTRIVQAVTHGMVRIRDGAALRVLALTQNGGDR